MQHRKLLTLLPVFALAGCPAHEGEYSPGCIAYAGSTISLDGRQFVWERFTDQVRIGADGAVIDPFPDYPKRGTYRLDGQAVHMEQENGESLDTMYLHKHGESYLLLTARENASWRQTGSYDACVLTLNSAAAN